MASQVDQLTLAIRALGANRTAAEVGIVTRAVLNQEQAVKKSNHRWGSAASPINATIRALKVVQTRTIINIAGITALSIALAALSPGLAFITGGMIALAAAMLPIAALAGLAALVFKNQFEIAGTAANDLAVTFMDVRAQFEQAFGPAANILLRGVARALMIIAPLFQALAPAMEAVATALAGGMTDFAQGLVAMAPQISAFIYGIVPLIPKMITLLLALTSAFFEIATRGIPAAGTLLDWMIVLAHWLQQAAINIDLFLRSADGQQALEHLVEVAQGFWWTLDKIGRFLLFVTNNTDVLTYAFGGLLAILIPLTLAMGLIRSAMLLYAAAQWLANSALLAFPGTWIVLAMVGITVALIELYQHWGWFHDAVLAAWDALRQMPQVVWGGLMSGLEAVGNFFIGIINGMIDAVNSALGLGQGGGLLGLGGIDKFGGPGPIAHVGTLGGARGGATSTISPTDQLSGQVGTQMGDQGGGEMGGVIENHITVAIDGKQAGKAVHRAAVKKKATK